MPRFDESPFTVVASGLGYPEGPVYRADGSVLLVEIKAGTLTRIRPDGARQVVATLGGGPNGAAIGPDGAVYVCNSGGFLWQEIGGVWVGVATAPDYKGGSIQRVASDGTFRTLYSDFTARNPMTGAMETHPLRGPDDLVFDATGSFWFTDWGKAGLRERDVTGVYYAKPDGSSIREVLFPLNAPNGLALSPDGQRLYVAETYTRRVLYWQLAAAGQIAPNPETLDGSYLLTAAIPGQGTLDSMKVDEDGNVYVATMLPKGVSPLYNGGITIISPSGEILQFLEIAAGAVEPLPSNLCFGGPDRRTLYVTLGGSGRLASLRVRVPGLEPAFD
jgi:gluconolactonase